MTARDIAEWHYGPGLAVSTMEELAQDIEAAIVEAVAAEREACAEIAADVAGQAETWKDEYDVKLAGPIARAIENRIRARGAAKQHE